MGIYVIGRSPKGRASLMHEIDVVSTARDRTLCGRDVSGGSRAYLAYFIQEVLCLRCIASRIKRDREGRL